MDFIVGLPVVIRNNNKYNAFYTCVDRLTKFIRIIPCFIGDNALTAAEVASLFFENIVRFFGVPTSIVHDRDSRFTSSFWTALW